MDGRLLLHLVALLGLCGGLVTGQMPGSQISPVSYHVCERTVTVNVSKVVLFQKPREEKSLCMGWIPSRLCSRTYYMTEYRTVWVPDTMVIKGCCEGYELVGHYCVVAANSPRLPATRPGTCPAKIDEGVQCPECNEDNDCPGFQKCCNTSSGSFCVSPEPPALDRNTIKFWYNGTITIKMKYLELLHLDPGFVNHTRLLHAMVTGELWPLESAVHHISTQPSGPFTITSRVLIGINQSVALQDIALSLSNIVMRLPEVINVQIDDLDECLHRELVDCPPLHRCVNTEGSYTCSMPSCAHQPAPGQACSSFLSHLISNVTTSGFHVSWTTDCPDGHIYNVQIASSERIHRNLNVSRTSLNISGLNAGELYTVLVTFPNCSGETQSWEERVKTEGQIMNGTLKINNRNLTGDMLNPNSTQYGEFVKKFTTEVLRSLSGLVPPDQVSVRIVSLSSGSIVVNFLIIINDTQTSVNATAASLSSMSQSSEFTVDPESVKLADFNECLSPSDNDCDIHAVCKNLDTSFTCECQPAFIDRDPSRPGRRCEGMALGGLTTPSTTSLYSTTAVDTSPPTTSSTAVIQTTATSSDHMTTGSKGNTGMESTERSTTFTTMAPSIDNEGSTTMTSTERSTPDPTMAPSIDNRGSTTMTATDHSTTDPTMAPSINNKGSTTMTATDHSTTEPTMAPSIDNEGSTTMTSTGHSTTGPMMAPSIKNNGSTMMSLTEHSTNGPMMAPSIQNNGSSTMTSTERSMTSPTMAPSIQNNGSTAMTSTEHSTTGSTMAPSIDNKGSTTMTTTEHSTTGPTMAPSIDHKGSTTMTSTERSTTTSPIGNKGPIILTSTTPKLATAPETMCLFSLSSNNGEPTSTPLRALQPTTTPPAPNLSLRDASKVICQAGKIGISIEKAFLRVMSISGHSLFLGSPECSVNCSTDTHIILLAGWKDCNTALSRNNTHTVVNSTLYIGLSTSSQNVTPGAISLIRCVFQNDILLSSGYNPAGGFYTIIENLEGQGSFLPEFQLFIGEQPIGPNFTLSATDDVTVRIGIKTEDSRLKVVISECWATLTENAYDPMSYPFIKNSCALPNTFTTIQTNGVSSNATFQSKIFSFVNKPIVYLHCRLYVCQEDVPNICKPACSGFRALGRSSDALKEVTRMGPLRLSPHDSDAATSPPLGPGYIILIAIGALAVIAIVVAILVCWHQRRTGNYNFKVNLRDVGYQVFSN